MVTTVDFDPFAIDGLLTLPQLDSDVSKSWSGFQFQAVQQNEFLRLDKPEQPKLTQLRSDVLKLELADVSLPTLDSASQSPTASSDNGSVAIEITDSTEEQEQDFWETPDLLVPVYENKLISWDHFNDPSHEEPTCAFVSEAGNTAFDLLLRKFFSNNHDDQMEYAKPDVLVSALFDLGLGRSSAIFVWNEQSQRFDVALQNFTLSGMSQPSLQHVINEHLDAGTRFRRLRWLVQSQRAKSSTRIALQTAVKSILDAIEDAVESRRRTTRSVLCLRDTFHKLFLLLVLLERLAHKARNNPGDSDLISATIDLAEQSSIEQPQFEPILHTLVSRTVLPTLLALQTEVGLSVGSENSHNNAEDVMSALLPSSLFRTYVQSTITLQLLEKYDHNTLLLLRKHTFDKSFVLEHSFDRIVSLQNKASAYEDKFRKLFTSSQTRSIEERLAENDTYDIVRPIKHGSPFSFDTDFIPDNRLVPFSKDTDENDESTDLYHLVHVGLSSEISTEIDVTVSSRQAVELSLGPLLTAQHRLLSYSTLQILFGDQNVICHIKLLGRFQMLNDGIFSAKLSLALFDSEQESGEGSRKLYGKTGLRLQSRETWPPASSELRLTLMGILSESTSGVKIPSLVDAVSFAIRDLSDEDLERCRDIDSIHALDFLRLNYKPPNSIIEAIITPQSLDKYDIIFNQLLRLLRMKALTQSMLEITRSRKLPIPKDNNHKFRIEAHRFITALADYYHNLVIKATWLEFETKLHKINDRIKERDYTGTLSLANGLDHLREMHDDTLDKIARGLLLKRRQGEAKGFIDRLFEVILRFAALTSRSSSHPLETDGESDSVTRDMISRLHDDFRLHVKALVRWLRVESGLTGSEGSEMFESLLLRLDWNGYWSK